MREVMMDCKDSLGYFGWVMKLKGVDGMVDFN